MRKIAILILMGQTLWAVEKGDLGYDYLRIPPSVNGYLFMYSMVRTSSERFFTPYLRT